MHLFLKLLIFIPLTSLGWGINGHRIVAEIAKSRLDPSTMKKVNKLLTGSMADASTWADEIRSDAEKRIEIGKIWTPPSLKGTKDKKTLSEVVNRWHYLSINKGESLSTAKRSKMGDIEYAIRFLKKILKDKKAPPRHRTIALKLLIHFVGDVHQPLHVGFNEDSGGNKCWVKWFPEKYIKNISPVVKRKMEYINLHKIWDEKLIESTKLSPLDYSTRLLSASARHMAFDLKQVKKFEALETANLVKKFKNTLSIWAKSPIESWLDESRSLLEHAYPKSPDGGERGYCFISYSKKIKEDKIPGIGWDERYRMLRIAEIRLLQAGIRLAHLLQQTMK